MTHFDDYYRGSEPQPEPQPEVYECEQCDAPTEGVFCSASCERTANTRPEESR